MVRAVRLIGGLGNQLFILAHGYSLDRNIRIDTSKWYAGQGYHPDSYRNTIFKNFTFGKGDPIPKGYYQGLKYCGSVIDEFVDKLEVVSKRIDKVAVHVRRGDYIGTRFEVCDESYYRKAMSLFSDQFTIFTDDPAWCKRFGCEIFEGSTEQAFRSMSNHKAVICSNSSFSWWASYISGVAVAPKRWYKDKEDKDIHRPGMICL